MRERLIDHRAGFSRHVPPLTRSRCPRSINAPIDAVISSTAMPSVCANASTLPENSIGLCLDSGCVMAGNIGTGAELHRGSDVYSA
jgi:hypothetical protein